MKPVLSFIKRLFGFYYEGFSTMSSWGKQVWFIIIIKLFVIFIILKLFFFRDFLKTKYDNDTQRSEYVMDQLINSPDKHD